MDGIGDGDTAAGGAVVLWDSVGERECDSCDCRACPDNSESVKVSIYLKLSMECKRTVKRKASTYFCYR